MAQDVARTEEKPAVHPVDQVLPAPQLAIYGFQHVLAFYAGAFHDVLFDAPTEKQVELIQAYPDIGAVFRGDSSPSVLSVKDQAFAGLDRLDTDEHHSLGDLTSAYRERFGFPLIIAVRENTKETILRSGNARLNNSPAAEQATALVEIAKIANLRLLDIVEEPDPVPAEPA